MDHKEGVKDVDCILLAQPMDKSQSSGEESNKTTGFIKGRDLTS
jgi:hypothetical protein